MKKFLVLYIILLFTAYPQEESRYFGWYTDCHIGAFDASDDLLMAIRHSNAYDKLDFVVLTGDITEKGTNDELYEAYEILDSLQTDYYIIPGNHDTKWSESGCSFFSLFGDDKFELTLDNTLYVGVNSGIPWRGGGGHIPAEDLIWLDSLVKASEGKEIIFFVHHPLDSGIDNWYKATNILREGNVKAVLVGHGHANKIYDFNGIPGAMSKATLTKKGGWGYTIVENTSDSLLFFDVSQDTDTLIWGAIDKTAELTIPKIDSAEFIPYAVKTEWKKDLQTTVSAPLLHYENNIFLAGTDGILRCFDLQGNEVWTFDAGSAIFSRPYASGSIIAVGTVEGDLYTLDIATGEVIQILNIGSPITSQLNGFPAEVMGEQTQALLVGTGDGTFYCYDMKYFTLLWESYDAGGMIETLPLVMDDRVIYGAWDGHLYCVDRVSGILNWKWTENDNFYYSPAAAYPVTDGKNVYITTPDKHVSAIDVLLGKTIWRKNVESWESIGIGGDKKELYIKTFKDNVTILNAKNGKPAATIEIGFGLDTMPTAIYELNGMPLFGTKSGIVYTIDKKNKPIPLLFLGTARLHTVLPLSETAFAAANMDGTVGIFTIEQ